MLPKWEYRDERQYCPRNLEESEGRRHSMVSLFSFPVRNADRMRCAIDLPFYFESENNGTKRNGALRGTLGATLTWARYLAGAGSLVLHWQDDRCIRQNIVLTIQSGLVLSYDLGAPLLVGTEKRRSRY